jgi:hypothetical protein
MDKMTVGEVRNLTDAIAFVDQHATHLKRVDIHMILFGLPDADGEALVRYIREQGIQQVGEPGL